MLTGFYLGMLQGIELAEQEVLIRLYRKKNCSEMTLRNEALC